MSKTGCCRVTKDKILGAVIIVEYENMFVKAENKFLVVRPHMF